MLNYYSRQFQVAEWRESYGYQVVPSKRDRHRTPEIMKNVTYIVTTIVVGLEFFCFKDILHISIYNKTSIIGRAIHNGKEV